VEGRIHGETVLGGQTLSGMTKPGETTATKLKRITQRFDMLLCEWFHRQPIARIGHDGLELGGGRSNPASLPTSHSEGLVLRSIA
jgi:hypothetical protein